MVRQAVAVFLLSVLSCAGFAADAPNVLVILVDDLGYGDLSSYGATDLQTPAIDALVSKGMRFDQFYANCPVCSPTRASLMSGRYPDVVGVPGVIRTHAENSWGWLAPDTITLPGILRANGYQTALVGKWHLGLEEASHPNSRGFDFFHGFLGDMMDDYYNHLRHNVNYMRENGQTIDPEGHASDLFSDWACDYLGSRVDNEKPFFLYLAYNAPHTPIQPPEEWVAKVTKRQPGINSARARLVALIEHLDAGIARVSEKLQSTGLDSNTLVIFTSDNGGQSSVRANNGPLREGKGTMYEGGIRVPACAVWPGRIAVGRSDRIGLTMDLYPTICEAAGVTVDHNIDGVSLLDTMRGEQVEQVARDIYFVRREGGDQFGGLTTRALRRANWKLLQNSPFGPLELFDLDNDPQEQTDLSSINREKYRELSAAMRVRIQRAGAVPWQAPSRRDN